MYTYMFPDMSSHAYLGTWVPLYVNTCLFGISFPLSVALKACVCLFSAKPRRERCVGAHRLARLGTTPHRNVWNYTQQGLAHPCLLSLASVFVILSPHWVRDRQLETKKHGSVYLKALSQNYVRMPVWKNSSCFFVLTLFLIVWGKSPQKSPAGTVPGIFIPVDNQPCLDSMTSCSDGSSKSQ